MITKNPRTIACSSEDSFGRFMREFSSRNFFGKSSKSSRGSDISLRNPSEAPPKICLKVFLKFFQELLQKFLSRCSGDISRIFYDNIFSKIWSTGLSGQGLRKNRIRFQRCLKLVLRINVPYALFP